VPSAEPAGLPADTDGLPVFTALGEETVLQGRFISVRRATFRDPDGETFERDIVRHPGAVAVVPVTDDRCVVLVHQYRPPVDGWVLEIPAGTCDVDGEPPETTAHRELAEEVGYATGSLTLLTRTVITPGFCDEVSSVYLATGLRPVASDRQGTEERFLRVIEVPLDRFDGMVDDGSIVDATTILGVALARRRLDRDGQDPAEPGRAG
jgi:8-oxo-dGTP pyrophosphatase MutT (NUDIX family)